MSPTKTLKNSGWLCRSRKRSTIWAKPTYTCVSDGCGWGDVNCLSYRNRPSGVAVFTFGQGFKTWVDLRLFFKAIYCQGKLCFYAKVTQFHCYLSILKCNFMVSHKNQLHDSMKMEWVWGSFIVACSYVITRIVFTEDSRDFVNI